MLCTNIYYAQQKKSGYQWKLWEVEQEFDESGVDEEPGEQGCCGHQWKS